MEVWILNEDFVAVGMIDNFQSFIWTERYTGGGDFELYTPANPDLLSLVKGDRYVWVKNSTTLMVIESIELESNVETGIFARLSGRSADCLFERRIIWPQTILDGTIEDAIYTLIDKNVMRPSYPQRQIRGISFKRSEDPRITSLTLSAQYYGDNLYETITKICDEAGIGYRMHLTTKMDALMFELYMGTNRTSTQNVRPRIVFSRKMDNLVGSNYAESYNDYKNAAFIAGEGDGADRMTTEVAIGTDAIGMKRREIFVDASDISRTYKVEVEEQRYDPEEDAELQMMIIKENQDEAIRKINNALENITEKYGIELDYSVPVVDQLTGEVLAEYEEARKEAYTSIPWVFRKDTEDPTGDEKPIVWKYTDGFYYETVTETREMTEEQYTEQLKSRGRSELSAKNKTMTLDGEIPAYTNYIYGVDYNLGDIVEIENDYGITGYARINEFIISHDGNGELMYPTFSEVN